MMNLLLLILLAMEIFHLAAHMWVMVGIGITNIEEKRWYFLWDGATPIACLLFVCFSSNVLSWWVVALITIHTLLHFGYYIPFFYTGYYAQRILNWSKAEYAGPRITADLFLTLYDAVLGHGLMILIIGKIVFLS